MKGTIDKKLVIMVGLACLCLIVGVAVGVSIASKGHEDMETAALENEPQIEDYDEEYDEEDIDEYGMITDDIYGYEDEEGLPDEIPSQEVNGDDVVKLNPTILYDNNGIGAFYTFLPEGWMGQVYTEYTVDQLYPLQSDILLQSPDGMYAIEMITPMRYYDETKSDGRRTEDDCRHDIMKYSTLYHYRNASEYLDFLASNGGYSWGAYEEFTGDSEAVNSYKNRTLEMGNTAANNEQMYSDISGGQRFGVQITLTDYDAQIISRRGTIVANNNGSMYAEATCCDSMYTYRSRYEIPNDLMELKYWDDITKWGPDSVNIYMAADQEAFDKYYDMAQFIMNNSGTTSMYEACKQQIIAYIIPKIVQGQQEMVNYMNDTVSQVVNSYNDTNDRVAQMWDDYILDQDRYTLSDGTQIVVPTTAEYVYYDGNDVIWSESASYEPGPEFQQIN